MEMGEDKMNKIKRWLFGLIGLAGLLDILGIILLITAGTFAVMTIPSIILYVLLTMAAVNIGFVAVKGDVYKDILYYVGLKHLGTTKRIIYGLIGVAGLIAVLYLVTNWTGVIQTSILGITGYVLSMVAAINWGIISATGKEDQDGLYYLKLR